MKRFAKYFVLIVVLSAFATGLFFYRSRNAVVPIPLPPAKTYEEKVVVETDVPKKESATPAPAKTALPSEVNLKVPFTSQAPHQNWDAPYKEFCEEASALMAYSYLKNIPILNADDADAKMLAIRDFELKRFGYYEDTNVEETAIVLKEFYGLEKIRVVTDPTIDDIRSALSEGQAVILPLAGQRIGNPFYHQPGPLYHMLVVKGYTKNGGFITNDPGTKRGADFIYDASVLMDALSDWSHETNNIAPEKNVMIVAG